MSDQPISFEVNELTERGIGGIADGAIYTLGCGCCSYRVAPADVSPELLRQKAAEYRAHLQRQLALLAELEGAVP